MPSITKEERAEKDRLLALGLKSCGACGEMKPVGEYSQKRAARDGLAPRCKPCAASYRADNREHRSEYNHAYYQENRQSVLDRTQRYYQENYAGRPHVRWRSNYIRRCNEQGVTPVLGEPFTREDVVAEYGDRCVYCGGEFQELDHYVPLAKGGEHSLENVRPSCASDNNRKGSKAA